MLATVVPVRAQARGNRRHFFGEFYEKSSEKVQMYCSPKIETLFFIRILFELLWESQITNHKCHNKNQKKPLDTKDRRLQVMPKNTNIFLRIFLFTTIIAKIE